MDQDEQGQVAMDFDRAAMGFLRRVSQFLLSVSVFSLALAFSFSVFSVFPHSFSVHFSTFLFSIFTRAVERKYMFLVCNGILFFLAKCSVDSGPAFSHSDRFVEKDSDSDLLSVNTMDVSEEEEKKQGISEAKNGSLRAPDDQLETEKNLIEEETENLIEEEEEVNVTDEVEEEEEEEEARGSEELNKKIEEFIRRMKEEMRMEAQSQTQLIAV